MNMKPEYMRLLAEIKEGIEKSRKTYIGTVEGIVGSRIGFVKIPENRQSFVIAPIEMDKVLPGDKVKILVKMENHFNSFYRRVYRR
jgi:exoribonuclease II